MISNQPRVTAQFPTAAPAGFVMPATGAISGTGLVRDRHVAGGTAVIDAPAYRPGSTAWSPPTC